jgi:hypothetical protein
MLLDYKILKLMRIIKLAERQGSSISITYMFLLDFLGNDFCRPYDSPYFIYHVQLSTIASLFELTVPVPGIAQPYHLLDTEAGNSHW